jgi:hypothetical protein
LIKAFSMPVLSHSSTQSDSMTSSSEGAVVEYLDPRANGEKWDATISADPRATFFHSSNWAEVLNATYGYKPIYVLARTRSESSALLPLMEVNSPFTGRRGVSLPFTDSCDLIGTDMATCRVLMRHALKRSHAERWKYLEFRGDIAGLGDQNASARFYGHIIKLQPDVTKLFAGISRRNQWERENSDPKSNTRRCDG